MIHFEWLIKQNTKSRNFPGSIFTSKFYFNQNFFRRKNTQYLMALVVACHDIHKSFRMWEIYAQERKSESKNDIRERKNFFTNDNSLTSLSSFVFKWKIYIFSTFSIQYATKRCFRCGVRVEFSQKKNNKKEIFIKFTTNFIRSWNHLFH